MHFNKEQTPLEIYSIPTRGFTAAVSVFGGTPPPKPLECKFWRNTIGALPDDLWADPIGGEPRLSCAHISIVLIDIIEMSPSFRSQIVHLSFLHWLMVIQGKQKPCLLFGKQGWKNSMVLLLPAYLRIIQIRFGGLPFIRCGCSKAKHTTLA
jgi:hypothetical protein